MAIKVQWSDPEDVSVQVEGDDADEIVGVLKFFLSDDADDKEPANDDAPLRYDALPPVQETNEIVVRDDGSFGGSFAKTLKLNKDPMRGQFVDVLVRYDDQDWNYEFTLSRAAAEDLLASLEILLRN